MPESHRPGARPARSRAAGEIVRGEAHRVGVPRRTAGSGRRRVDSGGQGGGAAAVLNGRGATGALVSLCPRPAIPCSLVLSPGAAGRWGYSVSGSRLSAGCAAGFLRVGRGSGLVCEGCGSGDLAWVPAVATGGQSDPRHPALGEPACGGCLKLKEINHLQHTTGAAHYSALPRSVGPHFSAGFPCIPSPLSRPPRRCSS